MRIANLNGKKAGSAKPGTFRRNFTKGISLTLAMITLLSVAFGGTAIGTSGGGEGPGSVDKEFRSRNFKEGSYGAYQLEHEDAPLYDGPDIVIPATDYVETNANIVRFDTYEGETGAVLVKDETAAQEEAKNDGTLIDDSELLEGLAEITYKVNIEKAGRYMIRLKYFPVEGKGSMIERGFKINGEYPFEEAEFLTFSRVWMDIDKVGDRKDSAGNEIRPRSKEAPEWREEYLNEDRGYYSDPFLFYFESGEHELTLVSQKEPIVIKELVFTIEEPLPTYEEVVKGYKSAGYKESSGQSVKIEAENVYRKSDSSLYPVHSRASVITSSVSGPFKYETTQVNVIGGGMWQTAGQWISWELKVPETGLYQISMRGRQNVERGMSAGRTLLINGEIPFEEAKSCRFAFSADFNMYTLGDEEIDEPFLFYFEAGKTYIIELKATLGAVEELARRLDASVNTLMTVYRRFLMIIGNEPDLERDYRFEDFMPEVLEMMADQVEVLRQISRDLIEETGEKSSNMAMLERAADRMWRMYDRTTTLAANFKEFKTDISAIANWILQLNFQPLELDYLIITSPDKALPKANAGFFAGMGHELRLFWSSFTVDYTNVGAEMTDEDAITVWFAPGAAGQIIGGGREQAQILKTMVEDSFIDQHNIPVNLQIIDMGALLPATLAGKGPDVALQVAGANPVQYAMRGAVHALTDFADFGEVAERFYESSLVQFTYQQEVFALPETQSFQLMFYRTDIMEELGIDVPATWNDVYDIIPELQNNYMNFGFPANINNFVTLIYQNNGTLYKGEGADLGYASNLDSQEAIEAFISYIDLYRSYKMDLQIDFLTRFRVGEAPIGIADFTLINQLNLSAPEIRGLWSFALVPGKMHTDEEGNDFVNRHVATAGNGSIILSKSDKKDSAWKFLKWWTSNESQTRYCLEVETAIGTAARIPSANKSVIYSQPWSAREFNMITAQRAWTKGIPEVPGGYYTTRHMDNAFNRTYTLRTDARETLLDYIDDINKELTKKRSEMGISTADDILGR